MKLNEITIKKDKMNRDTIKGRSGSYRSQENQAGITMTFSVDKDEEVEVAYKTGNKVVQKALDDLIDVDADWIKDETYNKK